MVFTGSKLGPLLGTDGSTDRCTDPRVARPNTVVTGERRGGGKQTRANKNTTGFTTQDKYLIKWF